MSSTRPWEEVSSTGGLQGQKGPHLHLSLLWLSRGFSGVGGVGGSDISAQRGVKFSVAVSFVLFQFLFREKWGWAGWCCGVVWWCGTGGWRQKDNQGEGLGTGVCIHRRGREGGPSQLVCAVYDEHELTQTFKATHSAINDAIFFKLSHVVNMYMNAVSHNCSDEHFTRVDPAKYTHSCTETCVCSRAWKVR